MTRYIAFLRAINVGGHVVKNDRLCKLFGELGCSRVEALLASGNIIFESRVADAAKLARQVERRLEEALGYEVATFLRTDVELQRIHAHRAFPAAQLARPDMRIHVGFLHEPVSKAARSGLLALCTPDDTFHFNARELYWMRRGGIGDSKLSGALLERTLGAPLTMRNANTVAKLVAKYPPATGEK
jgi:uncharacterized protein (DUF1697 family)